MLGRLFAKNLRISSARGFSVANIGLKSKLIVPYKFNTIRAYSAGSLSRDEVQARIINLLQSFDSVKSKEIKPNSKFTSDLGLDSLDAVEVVIAIEEEFGVEIPDKDADDITSVDQAVSYISEHCPDAV